jgi:hypothetical protein
MSSTFWRNHALREPKGNIMITASHITIGTTPVLIATGRCVVFVQQETGVIYLGDSAVTPSNGFTLNAVDHQFTIDRGDALYGVVASGSSVLEALIFS